SCDPTLFLATTKSCNQEKLRSRSLASCSDARIRLRAGRIREEIIGRSDALFPAVSIRRSQNFARLMLHEPASKHGSGKLLYPLIEHRRHFLAQIGRVAKTRKFVTLEAVT